jgi:hypothetical protein
MTDATQANEAPDFDNMSDEDFLKLDAQSAGLDAIDLSHKEAETLEDRLATAQPAADAAAAGQADETADPEEEDDVPDDQLGDRPAEGQPKEDGAKPADAGAETEAQGQTGAEDHTTPHQSDDKAKTPDAAATEPPNFEVLYKQIMAPFKANGKDFAPQSPEEAVRLMQQGANYTKKMQVLAPSLKMLRMLENNGLLQEEKLSFLIDLDRKDPKAIQKLLHDGKIDPLDLDTSSAPEYTPGNHSVSDQEMDFHTTLGDVMATPTGKDTVSHINTQWDQASKNEIYKAPKLLAIIDEQRANGLYDRISGEVERRRILGDLKNVPFIVAYKQVGDELHAQGKLALDGASAQVAPAQNSAPASAPRPVLDTRPATPKPSAPNGDKARALSSAPTAGKSTSAPALDPFTMSDEEIMRITSLKV